MTRRLRTTKTWIAAMLVAVATATHAAVDVNQATQADLESIPGIGPTLSTQILAQRSRAPFRDWADMVNRVGGIGPGSAARLSAAGLTVNGSAFAGSSGPARRSASASATAAQPVHRAASAASAPRVGSV